MTQQLSPPQAAENIIKYLKELAEPHFARQSQRFFKTPVPLLGIRAAQLRRTAQGFYHQIKKFWTLNQVLEFSELLFRSHYVEVRTLAIFVLGYYSGGLKKHHLKSMKSWLEKNYFDNWALIDYFCPQILSPLLMENSDLIPEIISWAESANIWVRRAAVVSFIRPVRQGLFLSAAYQVAEKLFSDKEDLIQKAVGWLLREAGKQDMVRLEKFLLHHGPKIPRTTLRYAIERFPENKRRSILIKTRPK